MRRQDEVDFFRALRTPGSGAYSPLGGDMEDQWPVRIAARLGIPEKRMYYILLKWDALGWLEYGVSIRCSWWTDKAPREMTAHTLVFDASPPSAPSLL